MAKCLYLLLATSHTRAFQALTRRRARPTSLHATPDDVDVDAARAAYGRRDEFLCAASEECDALPLDCDDGWDELRRWACREDARDAAAVEAASRRGYVGEECDLHSWASCVEECDVAAAYEECDAAAPACLDAARAAYSRLDEYCCAASEECDARSLDCDGG
mmetsp:Transcript_18450/g.54511  ORF Transcript_18450/g.54511 Transcript_18450/m.54511 type:complete len:163 (+) Transcript_18450:121-609(+)